MSDTNLREGDFLIGGTKGGYIIKKRLGEGGTGITHLATNAEGKYVAIKELKKNSILQKNAKQFIKILLKKLLEWLN